MDDIWTIVITAGILIVSALVGSKKKNVVVPEERTEEEKPRSPFSFFEEEDEEEILLKEIEKESRSSEKKYFTYDDQSISIDRAPVFLQEDENEKNIEIGSEKREFNIKEAIIYSEILNRPYS